eukprot:CAMPEP_0195028316 /NCGR_PEP_ID=MMETSP0326_2-20130528/54192_1 /TAXON_ID=2866 ORGANISM="Crypthecodinium cohnii, Strain Seligo" /NCGR_SAMPLE_ID=MMETSP0326_2 /ASSEMBLY_ACC=CAM_ASM_000348 /LENGTH=67 /DNA_ID=CAMNT_0040050799 /DNA_START=107 /DNA_END=310 /DNA_ORIENTATION=+
MRSASAKLRSGWSSCSIRRIKSDMEMLTSSIVTEPPRRAILICSYLALNIFSSMVIKRSAGVAAFAT